MDGGLNNPEKLINLASYELKCGNAQRGLEFANCGLQAIEDFDSIVFSSPSGE